MIHPIRTQSLTKRFRHSEALQSLTLEVPEGSVFALVGPNGAGKTTALKTILNIHRPTSGRAEVFGEDSRKLGRGHFTRIGYVSEGQRLPEWMKAGPFFDYCAKFYPSWSASRLEELIRLYEVPLNRKLSQLSRGMLIKAALASSLAYNPELLILDEPFGGLDIHVREQVIESILDSTPSATVMIASHDLGDIESFATHIAYLSRGRLVFAEELNSLTARFRSVELTLGQPSELPAGLPGSWLNVERSGLMIRFTDSLFDAGRLNTDVRAAFSGVSDVQTNPMPLRAIMKALIESAKSGRNLQ